MSWLDERVEPLPARPVVVGDVGPGWSWGEELRSWVCVVLGHRCRGDDGLWRREGWLGYDRDLMCRRCGACLLPSQWARQLRRGVPVWLVRCVNVYRPQSDEPACLLVGVKLGCGPHNMGVLRVTWRGYDGRWRLRAQMDMKPIKPSPIDPSLIGPIHLTPKDPTEIYRDTSTN